MQKHKHFCRKPWWEEISTFWQKVCLILFFSYKEPWLSLEIKIWCGKGVIFSYSWCSITESSTISYTMAHLLKHNKILFETKISLNAREFKSDPWRAIKDTLEESALYKCMGVCAHVCVPVHPVHVSYLSIHPSLHLSLLPSTHSHVVFIPAQITQLSFGGIWSSYSFKGITICCWLVCTPSMHTAINLLINPPKKITPLLSRLVVLIFYYLTSVPLNHHILFYWLRSWIKHPFLKGFPARIFHLCTKLLWLDLGLEWLLFRNSKLFSLKQEYDFF